MSVTHWSQPPPVISTNLQHFLLQGQLFVLALALTGDEKDSPENSTHLGNHYPVWKQSREFATNLFSYSTSKVLHADVRDTGLIPGSGRSPGGGHGNPLHSDLGELNLGNFLSDASLPGHRFARACQEDRFISHYSQPHTQNTENFKFSILKNCPLWFIPSVIPDIDRRACMATCSSFMSDKIGCKIKIVAVIPNLSDDSWPVAAGRIADMETRVTLPNSKHESLLSYVNHAEDLASKLLQCSPKNRLSAQAALSHEYFSDLPPRLWELTDMSSIFTVPNVRLQPEAGESMRTFGKNNSYGKSLSNSKH
ncbi:hypothetical protein FD755_012410 [Muntiacus reevesi]|uniref:Protein kinase domain-containing protein n=1 Tax=Muntiacus reevesi TaxID=9886 RepID=A0A5N3XPA5_MUNRE|nr:hypothetical protein FD755_012410 [Muntiacus reevesi]